MASESEPRVLLTGATGFIGRAVVSRLVSQGVEVLALTTDANGVRAEWGIEAVDADRRLESLAHEAIRAFRPSVLLHLAWSGLPDYSATSCLSNVEYSTRTIRTALDSGVSRFVGAGSCWEYGDRQGSLQEDMTSHPLSMFAQAKSCIRELLATTAGTTGAEARWGRIFYVYGPGQRKTSLIPMAIEAFKSGKSPELQDSKQAIDLIHVGDVADGLVLLALAEGPSGTFNLGSGSPVRVTDVVELVRAAVTGDKPALPEGVCGDIRASWADIVKMSDAFGWYPSTSLADGIKHMLDENWLL